MNKYHEAFNQILTEYTDYYGMVCLHPAVNSDPVNLKYDAENQHLYTGLAGIMLKFHGEKIPFDLQYAFKQNVASTLTNTKISDGLYARHPEPYVLNKGHELSHDEHVGILCYLVGTNSTGRANELCDYGKTHSWAFIEEEIGLCPKSYALRNPRIESKRLWKQISNYRKGQKTPNHEGSYMLRIRLPEIRAFMKIIAPNYHSNLYGVLNLLGASILATGGDIRDTSVKIMMFNKLMAMKMTGYKSRIVRFARKRFHKKMVKMYGENYYNVIIKIYYGEDHPFAILSENMTLED